MSEQAITEAELAEWRTEAETTYVLCNFCTGTGKDWKDSTKPCHRCSGTGKGKPETDGWRIRTLRLLFRDARWKQKWMAAIDTGDSNTFKAREAAARLLGALRTAELQMQTMRNHLISAGAWTNEYDIQEYVDSLNKVRDVLDKVE